MSLPRLVQITDRHALDEAELMARIDRAASLAIIVRDKDLPQDARRQLAARVLERARSRGGQVLIAADIDIAEELSLDGVHLPEASAAEVPAARKRLGSGAIITVACHDVAAVLRAAELGADAALLSPVFASPGKATPIGLDAISAARGALDRQGANARLVGLGGIDERTADLCLRAGADGVAVIRADLTRWAPAGDA